MAKKKDKYPDSLVPIPFPSGGLNEQAALQYQAPYTTPNCANVRPADFASGRESGCQRTGTFRYCPTQLVSEDIPVQDIIHVSAQDIPPPPQGGTHVPITITGGSNTSVGTTDEEGNLYVIGDDADSLLVRKYAYVATIDPDTGAYLAGPGTIAWEDNPLPGTSGTTFRGLGVVYNGWLYSWGTNTTTNAGYIWRHASGTEAVTALPTGPQTSSYRPAFMSNPYIRQLANLNPRVQAFARQQGQQVSQVDLNDPLVMLALGFPPELDRAIIDATADRAETEQRVISYVDNFWKQYNAGLPAATQSVAPVTGTLVRISPSPWITTSDNVLTWTAMAMSFSTQLALAKNTGYLGLVANDGVNGLRLRLISTASATTVATTTINAGNDLGASDICSDGDNFYVAWASAAGTPDRLSKFDFDGTLVWTLTGSTALSGVAYDFLTGKLYAVGNDIGGSGFTVAEIDPSDGTVDDGANVSSSVWTSIRPTGRGKWVIGKSGSVALISGDGAFTVEATVVVAAFNGYGVVLSNAAESSKAPTGVGGGSGTRVTRLIGVSKGTVTGFDQKGLIPVLSGSAALSPQRNVIFSAQVGRYLYYADGVNEKRYNIGNNTMETWTASVGTIPIDGTMRPTLIENWRGRLVLAGIPSDPHNWFMSRQGDPTDWAYTEEDEQSAVAGNNALAGLSPDTILAMLPYSDDLLIFGCDHSLWRMTGDPMAGGRFDRISDTIGMAWGRPYCRDSIGTIYFMSSRGRVYRMAPYGSPEPISNQIDQRLANIDLASKVVRMAWSDEENGFYLTLSPVSRYIPTVHFWYDASRGSWWPDVFKNVDHNPRVVYVYDGDNPRDRCILLGCNDGYVRTFNENAVMDDEKPITSYIFIGPFQSATEGVLLKELQGILTQGNVIWSVHVGSHAKEALGARATDDGIFIAGRNHSQPARRHGHSIFLRLSNDVLRNRWVMEELKAVLLTTGRGRQRMF